MNDTICLLGNTNCGKTTLFNHLTGTYQKTGNWSGVTTEKKIGRYRKNKKITIVDLPGVYSLSAISDDERAVVNYLKNTPPKAIINVIDGTNLERSLYLTVMLSTLNIPTVIAVNMADQLEKNGIKLNAEKLSTLFNVPVIMISAKTGKNVEKLIKIATTNTEKLKRPTAINFITAKGQTDAEKIYSFIGEKIKELIIKKPTKAEIFTLKADKVLMHKVWGMPIFFAIISIVYLLSIKLGGILGEFINLPIISLENATCSVLTSLNAKEWAISLISAIMGSLGEIFAFLPQILILFTLLTLLEQSGYTARSVFVTDRFFSAFGLSGRSVIPLTLCAGCTVSGIMATRTIDSEREKRITLFLAPFMPCSAKMAVFGWFSQKLFNGNPLVATSLYFLSIFCVAFFGKILNKIKALGSNNGGFLLEIPLLRVPSIKDVLYTIIQKTKDFIAKAGSVILAVAVILWALKSFGFHGYIPPEYNGEGSFLYTIGNIIKYIFYPLGFGNWQASVAVLSGIMAKEGVIETLTLVSNYPETLFNNGYSAYAFMTFILLSPPCIAAISTLKKELKSVKWLVICLTFQTVCAYLIALLINLTGLILTGRNGLHYCLIFVIIMLIIAIALVLTLKRRKKAISR
ncbi:MAG: ferrous iron transporter B [Clostridia bacterium]|nr:ferrous iron transporter B [Clostridia bacterium]